MPGGGNRPRRRGGSFRRLAVPEALGLLLASVEAEGEGPGGEGREERAAQEEPAPQLRWQRPRSRGGEVLGAGRRGIGPSRRYPARRRRATHLLLGGGWPRRGCRPGGPRGVGGWRL